MTNTLFLAFLVLFLFSNVNAQTAVTSISATYDNITDTSDNYTVGSVNYNFNVGTQNNLILQSINVGSLAFRPGKFADRVEIVRVDNPVVSGNKQLMFYELESQDVGSFYNLKPSFRNTMEEVLLSPVINRGTDNVFGNQGDGSGNNNNIERIDFIFDDGLVVPPNPAVEGFIILERGGNDAFKIAAITSLNPDGSPGAYGSVVSVPTTGWGSATSFSIQTAVMSSPTPANPLERTTTVASQPVRGVSVTYGDLGLSGDDVFFGFALAGGDVTTNGTNWTDVTNESFFPRNTSSTSGAEGGLDLMAGGSFFSSNLVESSYTLTGDECWRMLSSPVPTTYANLLNGLWTQGTVGANFTGGEPNVLIWPTGASGNSPGGWLTPSSLFDSVPAGTGVLVSVYSDDNFDGTPNGFNKIVNISGTGYSGDITPTLNNNDDGWTLVGNPYNFPINFGSGDLTKTNINNVAYVYDRNLTGTSEGVDTNNNTGGWRTTDGNYGDLENGIIAPFQGFFIQNNGSGSVFTFSEGAEDTSGDGQFYGKEKERPENVVRFEMNGEGLFNSAWITLSENGSNERTNSDALELIPFGDDYLLFGSRKGDSMFDIAHFPTTSEKEIPIEIETTRSGNFTITATNFDVNPDMELLFMDTQENISIPVSENFEYTFELDQTINKAQKIVNSNMACGSVEQVSKHFIPTAAKVINSSQSRFILKVQGDMAFNDRSDLPDTYNLLQNYPNPFNPVTQITYELPQNSDVRLEVFDMSGRQVATLVNGRVNAGTHTVQFDAANLSSGVYMYRLQAGNTVLSQKLTLIK